VISSISTEVIEKVIAMPSKKFLKYAG